jgi:hypothetical protein
MEAISLGNLLEESEKEANQYAGSTRIWHTVNAVAAQRKSSQSRTKALWAGHNKFIVEMVGKVAKASSKFEKTGEKVNVHSHTGSYSKSKKRPP